MNPDKIRNILNSWQGGFAQVWEYTVSHGHLEIRLTKNGFGGNLHLICEDCSYISFNSTWKSVNIKIEELKSENAQYLIQDKKASLYIECNLLMVRENVEPIYNKTF